MKIIFQISLLLFLLSNHVPVPIVSTWIFMSRYKRKTQMQLPLKTVIQGLELPHPLWGVTPTVITGMRQVSLPRFICQCRAPHSLAHRRKFLANQNDSGLFIKKEGPGLTSIHWAIHNLWPGGRKQATVFSNNLENSDHAYQLGNKIWAYSFLRTFMRRDTVRQSCSNPGDIHARQESLMFLSGCLCWQWPRSEIIFSHYSCWII